MADDVALMMTRTQRLVRLVLLAGIAGATLTPYDAVQGHGRAVSQPCDGTARGRDRWGDCAHGPGGAAAHQRPGGHADRARLRRQQWRHGERARRARWAFLRTLPRGVEPAVAVVDERAGRAFVVNVAGDSHDALAPVRALVPGLPQPAPPCNTYGRVGVRCHEERGRVSVLDATR